jgi:hypothetical protein
MSSILVQPDALAITFVANSVISTIQHEESQLPATIILQQPLLHVKLTTRRACLHLLAVLIGAAMATTPLENRHFLVSFSVLFFGCLPASVALQTLQTTRSGHGTSWNLFFLFFSPVFSAAFSGRDTDNSSPARRPSMYPPSRHTRQQELGP